MVVLGWIVIVLGVVATLAGIAGAVAQMMRNYASRKGTSLNDLPTDFIEAITQLIQTLIQAPIWLVLVILGFALLVYGGTLIR
ncbi:MAG: hypothetical protein ACXWNQ_05195 [Anaerolineales bacterium]|jgi:hypothetical protein